MNMIADFTVDPLWEHSEAEPQGKCEFCEDHAVYLIGPLRLCLTDLMRLRAEVGRMVMWVPNEGASV